MRVATLLFSTLCSISSAAVRTVEVGNGGLVFNPTTLTASAGDTIIFELFASHNVVQGNFASPCTPSAQGFYSGPYSESNDGKLRFVVNLTSTNPIYYYCSVGRHCQSGMVGGINLPTGAESFEAYKRTAANVTGSVTPAQRRGGILQGGDQLKNLTSSSSSATPFSYSPTATGTASPTATPAKPSIALSSTGAAVIITPIHVQGLAAVVFGFAAWVL